ncbi:hypothetical protein [Pseudomonas putida]|uniref:hypothetical protein n=1 Tax=Pseudomonas putida TaxID=303 RepID=UPI00210B0B8C|nr:hypothetical protein [Pseudomonas putida]
MPKSWTLSNWSHAIDSREIAIRSTDSFSDIHHVTTEEKQTLPELSALIKAIPDHAELTVKLNSKPQNNSSPNWTLSTFEQARLEEQYLQIFKTLPTTNADAFNTIKHFLLKVRYLPADQYSELMGVTNIEQPRQPIALHTAIDNAKALDKADAFNTLIAQELNALKKITSGLPDESLQAILRLRYLHPATCRRILFYLDPKHEMAFEDRLIANGKGAVNFALPLNKDIRDYTVSLDFYDEHVSTTDPIATATCAYTLEEKDDDAIPSVQICRNETQALYLDFKEVNDKAEDQTNAPPFPYPAAEHPVWQATGGTGYSIGRTVAVMESPTLAGAAPGICKLRHHRRPAQRQRLVLLGAVLPRAVPGHLAATPEPRIQPSLALVHTVPVRPLPHLGARGEPPAAVLADKTSAGPCSLHRQRPDQRPGPAGLRRTRALPQGAAPVRGGKLATPG